MMEYVEHYEKREYIYPLSRREIYFQIKTNIQNIEKIEFIYFEKIRDIGEKNISMHNFNFASSSQFYYGKLLREETIKYINYYFEIKTTTKVFYFSPEGLKTQKPRRSFLYTDTNYNDVFITPKWAQGIIGYQIFPDRFNIGGKNLLEKYSEWTEKPTRDNFFGGNIAGIIEKIDYLKSIKTGLLYLTPIFKSYSNHKYDTIDYFEIDPGFGTKEQFRDLIGKLHNANIKIIIDGVFNHIGYYSKQFQDVIENGKDSKYFDWFYINDSYVDTENINYECVGYYKWMPKLNYKSLAVREYIKNAGEYWLKEFHIDGYRLDVSDEVDFTFWQEFRRHIKSISNEAILIGETWKNGSDLLRGDSLDSIMNYRLRNALLDLVINKNINVKEFINQVNQIYFDYPQQTHNILYNTLGTHDTERIFTLCDKNQDMLFLLVSFILVLPGIPFIYYGDELGMTGLNDPFSRKPIDWSKTNNVIHNFFIDQIASRDKSNALKKGNITQIEISENVYGLIRKYENEEVLFIANISSQTEKFSVKVGDINKEFTLLPYKSEIINI